LNDVGYLPGELAFPESLSGNAFIKFVGGLRKLKNFNYAKELAKLFDLDTKKVIKYMSLGQKRKLAIVVAFMHNPSVLVLDEPTSGLDPMMQEVFIKYIKSQKELGKTVLLSSHIYAEVEALCDRLSIIKQGKIISTCDIKDVKIQNEKKYKIEFKKSEDYHAFIKNKLIYIDKNADKLQVHVEVSDKNINQFLKTLADYDIKYIAEDVYTLEDYFMHFYKKGGDVK
jgi:ABC-2 type transport system ATP-binding protein